MFRNLREFIKRNERHLSSLALIVGFLFDTFTLRRADLIIEYIVLLLYVGIVASCIVWIHVRPKPWNLILMQFCLGNLFSAFLIFYSRSGSAITSWPFLLILVGLMIVNERLREKYARLTFQISVFFCVLFSYAIFLVPIILRQMGSWVFVLSGGVSIGVLLLFMMLLQRYIPHRVKEAKTDIIKGVIIIFSILNIFYFTNIIPPIPLSLKEIGVYELVSRNPDGSYKLIPNEDIRAGEKIYAYSAVFAPTRLDVQIVHSWEYFDPSKARWVSVSKIPFKIVGGRDGGFRGYSIKENVFAGLWRVNVETVEGRLIGRKRFEVHQ